MVSSSDFQRRMRTAFACGRLQSMNEKRWTGLLIFMLVVASVAAMALGLWDVAQRGAALWRG